MSVVVRKLREYLKVRSFCRKLHRGGGYKKGFSDATINVCGVTKDNFKEFLTDKDYILGHPYNGPYSSIIDNKLWLPMFLRDYAEYVPRYYFYIDEAGLLPLDGGRRSGNSPSRVPVSAFFDLLGRERTLCLKHTHSSVGKGFMSVRQEEGEAVPEQQAREQRGDRGPAPVPAAVYRHGIRRPAPLRR